MLRDKDYYIHDTGLMDYYCCLGEKARAEFLEWLTKHRLPSTERNASINYDYSTDYRDDVYRAGDCIVYLYTNEMGVPFYVGKGSEERALNVNSRNKAFTETLNRNGVCRIFAIVSNIYDKDALEIETLVINELLNRGWRLTNSSKTSISSDDMQRLIEDYPNVMKSINEITRTGLTSLLDDTDCFGETGKVVRHSKTYMRKV